MATIKEVSEEVGVSKEAVRKRIRQLGLQNSCQKVGNKLSIPNSVVEQLKESFSQTRPTTENANEQQPSDNELVSELRNMLAEQNKQIEFLRSQNAELLRSLQAEQTLRAQEVGKLLETSEANRSRWERLKAAWRG